MCSGDDSKRVMCLVPGVALKIMRVFRCETIEGKDWLAADMRLRCYDAQWAGYGIIAVCAALESSAFFRRQHGAWCPCALRYAFYALVCGIVYVVGFPLSVFVILYRRRRSLFHSSSSAGNSDAVDDTLAKYGFLYEVGPQC